MTRRTGEDVLTREEADRRIRGTARVASALCWVAAALALALAAWSLFAAAWVTWSSAQASGTDLVTAFLTTSEASGDFVLAETEPQDPVYRYDEGNVVGMAQTGAGTVSLCGNPLQLTVRGVVSAGLSGAAFALAALLCGRVRRTGEVFSPRRARARRRRVAAASRGRAAAARAQRGVAGRRRPHAIARAELLDVASGHAGGLRAVRRGPSAHGRRADVRVRLHPAEAG